jgi:hypothetical protein
MEKLPKTLTLKLEVEIDLAQITYNAIQFASIYDENNELIAGEE